MVFHYILLHSVMYDIRCERSQSSDCGSSQTKYGIAERQDSNNASNHQHSSSGFTGAIEETARISRAFASSENQRARCVCQVHEPGFVGFRIVGFLRLFFTFYKNQSTKTSNLL